MSTARQNILARIKEDLEAIASIKEVYLYESGPMDLETVPMPCAFIHTSDEARLVDSRAVIGYETWSWQVVIEVWAVDKEMEDLLNDIHTKMYSDNSFNDYAIVSYRTGVDFLFIDPERALESMLITYEITYRHVKGTM